MTRRDSGTDAELARLSETWSSLGESDPYWAVLSDPEMRGGGWDDHLDQFLASGNDEVDQLALRLDALGMTADAPVLELGCGVGRVTQALARRFGEAHGVDIALPMIARARERNDPGCTYHHNTAPNLRMLGATRFGLIYSRLVFQHMPATLGRAFLTELLRVAAPGGTVVVQIPSERRGAARFSAPMLAAVRRVLRQPEGQGSGIEMHGIPRTTVEEIIERAGGELVAADGDRSAGDDWASWVFVIRAGG